MGTTNILPQTAHNGQSSQETDNQKIDDIRRSIKFLRAVFGDCLNTWPQEQQTHYHELARHLRQLEHGGER